MATKTLKTRRALEREAASKVATLACADVSDDPAEAELRADVARVAQAAELAHATYATVGGALALLRSSSAIGRRRVIEHDGREIDLDRLDEVERVALRVELESRAGPAAESFRLARERLSDAKVALANWRLHQLASARVQKTAALNEARSAFESALAAVFVAAGNYHEVQAEEKTLARLHGRIVAEALPSGEVGDEERRSLTYRIRDDFPVGLDRAGKISFEARAEGGLLGADSPGEQAQVFEWVARLLALPARRALAQLRDGSRAEQRLAKLIEKKR